MKISKVNQRRKLGFRSRGPLFNATMIMIQPSEEHRKMVKEWTVENFFPESNPDYKITRLDPKTAMLMPCPEKGSFENLTPEDNQRAVEGLKLLFADRTPRVENIEIGNGQTVHLRFDRRPEEI
jgi:hypothetical protein